MANPTRRQFLHVVSSASVGLIAGCSASTTHQHRSQQAVTDHKTMSSHGDASPPMIAVAGGVYTIGSDTGPQDAQPAHDVQIQPFRIDRYEVTNTQFAVFLNTLDITPLNDASPGAVTADDLRPRDADRLLEGREGTEHRPLAALDDEHSRIGITDGQFVAEEGYGRHPVNEVTWDGARAFAQWRDARLPTEVEWEAAARGFEGRLYPWGDTAPTPERAVYGRDSGQTAPVGTHPKGATPTGIHDMAGNVSEWTSSLYRSYPYDAADGRENLDVRGERVTRGGAHVFFSPDELRTFYRTGFSREFDRGHRHIGFRCVESGH